MIVGLEKYAYDDFCASREGTNSALRNDEDENKEFKSKNLEAERRRRQKLSDRLLELRSLVPNISNAMIQEPFNPFTWFLLLIYCLLKHIFICILPCKLTKSFPNSDIVSILQMNKATIITDAIAYIEELQSTVRDLSDQLYQMDLTLKEATENQNKQIVDAAEEMKKWGIQPEVRVTRLNETRLWIQIVCQKKNCGFTKLMEAISVLGYDLKDISVTTAKGALLVTTCVEVIHDGCTEVDKIEGFLLETIRRI